MAIVATTDEKACLLDLVTGVLELTRDGNRNPTHVAEVLQVVKDHPDFRVRLGLMPKLGIPEDQLSRWQKLYRDDFGIELDIGAIRIPNKPPAFNRLIVVHESLTLNQIAEALRKRFKVWTFVDDLDKDVSDAPGVKRPKVTYALWVRERQEADEELKNKSVNDLEQDGINCLTLKERLLYEFIYHDETGEHLDQENRTLCAGSCDSDDGVPYVYWFQSDERLRVGWTHPWNRYGGLRARRAVS